MGGARARAPRALLAALVALAAAGCSRPLPDPESPGARAYAEQCGLCHPPHYPGLMTAAMWKIQMERMEEQRRRRGLAPMTPEQTKLILDYLTEHAG